MARSIATGTAALASLLLLAACSGPPAPGPMAPAEPPDGPASAPAPPRPAPAAGFSANGILVMAHGGTEAWNDAAARVAEALKEEAPTALAFGMADRRTLRASLDSLREAGVERVAVVRMFLSGSSFREQTEWFLGMSDQRPAFFISHGGGGGDGGHPAGHDGDHDPHAPIRHGLAVATHDHGLMNAPEAGPILLDRALALSEDPARESVLVIGHGMGREDANDAVLAAMDRAVGPLRRRGFAAVAVTTLREDWAEARTAAEAEILAFARREVDAGRRLLVLPFRLFGFGPYADVLGDLPYTPGQGLLPNDRIAGWALRTARSIFCTNGWAAPDTECPAGPVMAEPISEAEPSERLQRPYRPIGR